MQLHLTDEHLNSVFFLVKMNFNLTQSRSSNCPDNMRLPSRAWLCTLPSPSSLPLVKRYPAHVLTREPATVERAIKNGRHNVVSLFFSFYKMLAKYRETFLGRNIRVQSVYAKTYYLFENILAGPRLISLFTHYEKKVRKDFENSSTTSQKIQTMSPGLN